ncbi:MAG: branched-chain-amino-acid transaminase [bacterium]
MNQTVYYNGKIMPLEQASVNVFDHGHLYGDGVFEGIRVYNGRVFKVDEHLDRLYAGAQMLALDVSLSQGDFKQAILDTVKAANATNETAYVRVNVTRGSGLGLDPRNLSGSANMMVAVSNLSLYPQEMYETGLDMVTVSTRVFPPQCLEPRLKTIGRYVSNIQAKIEATRQGAGEGLMLTLDGYVAEATGDNIFVIKDGVLMTPPIYAGILGGITRASVIKLAKKLSIPVEERLMTLFDVYTADEVFLTGTAAELICSTKVDGRVIADGKFGSISRRILAAFRELTQSDGVKV